MFLDASHSIYIKIVHFGDFVYKSYSIIAKNYYYNENSVFKTDLSYIHANYLTQTHININL